MSCTEAYRAQHGRARSGARCNHTPDDPGRHLLIAASGGISDDMNRVILAALAAGVSVVALAGCSMSPYVPEQKFAGAAEKRQVRLAGSRIYQMVDMSDASPATRSPVRIITSKEIAAQGAGSLTDVLGFYSFPSPGGH